MSVSQGSYTFGTVTSDYATWELAIADLAFPLTGDLTLTGEADATITTGFFVNDVNLAGHTLTFDGGGYSYQHNTGESLIRIDEPKGADSQVIIQNWKIKRLVDASPTFHGIVYIYRPQVNSQIFTIRDCSFDMNDKKGHGIILIYNLGGVAATTYITNVVSWGCTTGSDSLGSAYAGITYYDDGFSTYVNCDAENCTIYDCEGVGFEVGSGQGDLKNVACFDNGTDFANTGSLNLFSKCASSDATGSEAGLRNLTAADCFESLTDTDADFLYPKTTGDLYGAGANVSIPGHTEYYNDVTIETDDVDIGAYGIDRDVPPSTGDSWLNLGTLSDKFTTFPNWIENPNNDFVLNQELLSFLGTATDITIAAERIRNSLEYRFLFKDREESYSFLDFFASRFGRLERFWLPEYKQYFQLYNDISQLDSSIDVCDTGFNKIYQGYERLFIYTSAGDSISRKITNVVDNGDYETLTLQSAINRDLTTAQIVFLGRLFLVRFDIDEVEVNYVTDSICEVNLRFMELVKEYETIESGGS